MFLGWTSTKQRIKSLAQGHLCNTDLASLELTTLWSQLYHWVSVLLGLKLHMWFEHYCHLIFLSIFSTCELCHFRCHNFIPIYTVTGCLVGATPPTILFRSFWNLSGVLILVWRFACGLDIIVTLFFVIFFSTCELCHFVASQFYIFIYTVKALWVQQLLQFYSDFFLNLAGVLFMVWRCACGLDIIVRLNSGY